MNLIINSKRPIILDGGNTTYGFLKNFTAGKGKIYYSVSHIPTHYCRRFFFRMYTGKQDTQVSTLLPPLFILIASILFKLQYIHQKYIMSFKGKWCAVVSQIWLWTSTQNFLTSGSNYTLTAFFFLSNTLTAFCILLSGNSSKCTTDQTFVQNKTTDQTFVQLSACSVLQIWRSTVAVLFIFNIFDNYVQVVATPCHF